MAMSVQKRLNVLWNVLQGMLGVLVKQTRMGVSCPEIAKNKCIVSMEIYVQFIVTMYLNAKMKRHIARVR